MRPKGSRNRLLSLTYDTIAEMAGGITGDTAKQYAQRGEYDSGSLESVLLWVNSRRIAKGMPLFGLPTDVGEAASDEDGPRPVSRMPASWETSPLYYDPRSASYRVNDI